MRLLFKIRLRVCFCRKLGFHNSAAAHPELPVARHRSAMGAAFAGAHHGWTGDGRSALCSSRGRSSVSQKEDAVQLRHLEKQEIRHLGLHHPPDPPWLFRPLRPHGEIISSCKKIYTDTLDLKKTRLRSSQRGSRSRMALFWSCAWDSPPVLDELFSANWPICLGWIEFCCSRSVIYYFYVYHNNSVEDINKLS